MRGLGGGHADARAGRRTALAVLCLGAVLALPVARAEPAGDTATPAIVLVSPERSFGTLRVDTVATDPAIDRVVFFLDGDEVGTDRSAPFSVRLEVPADGGSRTLRSVALDREGNALGEDSLSLGPPARAFDVSIRRIEGNPATGWVEVEVTATVPAGARLARLELYRNGDRIATSNETPMRRRVATPHPAPDDYLRAVAVLAGGAVIEDARLLASVDPGERLDVNLVELVALAAGRDGTPVRGLGPEDFRVVLGGRDLPIQRFREAREVPLTLGLLVDSSASMRPVMDQTREAAGRFLDRTLAPGDRAFLVDVDTRPRLAHGLTEDPRALAAAFDSFEADGDTALYDSLAFGALELLRLPGRRALVVLSDGEDSASYLGLHRCLDLAKAAGIPVYVISVGGLSEGSTHPDDNLRLGAFARETGGRLYAVTSTEEVDRAYDQIERELRSQYVLAVATDRRLDRDELAGLEVRARSRGVTVRVARRGGP